jgi:hypothetical protein
MTTLPQQPSSITEILIASFRLYKNSFTKWIGYGLIAFVIAKLNDVTFMPDSYGFDFVGRIRLSMQSIQLQYPHDYNPWSILIKDYIVTMIKFVAMSLIYSAMVYRIDNQINGQKDNFVEALLLVFKKSPSIILATVFYAVITTIVATLIFWISPIFITVLMLPWNTSESTGYGIFFLLSLATIPGAAIISLLFSFFGYFVLLEKLSSFQSLKASCQLVWGQWWRTFLVFLTFAIPFFGIRFILFAIDDQGYYGGSNNSLNHSLSLILMVFVIPYFFVLGYLQYHDLKLRKNLLNL